MNKRLIPLLVLCTLVSIDAAFGQQYVQGYTTYREVPVTSGDPLLFGVAAYKLCSIKNFLFSSVYILGAMAFVLFAIRALFTKFELKQFVPIIGALFIVATSDLLIAFMSPSAVFCPTAFSTM